MMLWNLQAAAPCVEGQKLYTSHNKRTFERVIFSVDYRRSRLSAARTDDNNINNNIFVRFLCSVKVTQ